MTGFIFLIGCSVGSFLNVVAVRLSKGDDFIVSRSRCQHCHHPLGVLDMVPILSWVLLRGRCRYCNSLIELRYVISELVGGIGFLLTYLMYSESTGWKIADLTLLFAVGELCSLIDIEEQSVYPIILFWAWLLHLGMVFCDTGQMLGLMYWLSMMVGILLYAGVYGIGYLIWHQEAFGVGDILYLGLIGSWVTMDKIVTIGLLAFIVGGMQALFIFLLNRRMDKYLSFIPAIFIAEMVVLYTGFRCF